jgi:hypothetical protein
VHRGQQLRPVRARRDRQNLQLAACKDTSVDASD